MGDLDRRRLGRLTPASLAFARGLGLPEMYTIMATKEAGTSLPEVEWSCVGVARDERRNYPFNTGTTSYHIQDAICRFVEGVLDLV